MEIIAAAFVSFAGVMLLLNHIAPRWMRRFLGYNGWFDLFLHAGIWYMFFGTSTMGLLQAELAGIFFSLYLRALKKGWGYEKLGCKEPQWRWLRSPFRRLTSYGWIRHAGRYT